MPEGLTLPILITAALLDSINPCVIGVLVFLLVLMTKAFGKKSGGLVLLSSIYVLTVYVAYFVLGLGIVKAVFSFNLTIFFYSFVALVAFIAGLLELKDFFWYGKGFNLAIFPKSAARLEKYSKKMLQITKKPLWMKILFMIGLGLFVVVIELPCTGAPYLAILGLIAQGDIIQAIPLLLLYNLIFILPLIVVIIFALVGTKLEKVETWRKKYRKWMRLAVGLFLIALSIYMIQSIWPLLITSFK